MKINHPVRQNSIDPFPIPGLCSPVIYRLPPPGVFCQLKKGNTDPLIKGDPRFLKETASTHAGSLSNGYRRPFSAMPFAFLAYCPASSVIFLTTSSFPASV